MLVCGRDSDYVSTFRCLLAKIKLQVQFSFFLIIVLLSIDVLNGYNGTIFAYGQTSSGKTHTMEVSF